MDTRKSLIAMYGAFRSLSYGAPLPGLCACAPADRGATKALKEEGKTQAEVAARVSTGFVTEWRIVIL